MSRENTAPNGARARAAAPAAAPRAARSAEERGREGSARLPKPVRVAFIIVFIYLIVSLVLQQFELFGLQARVRELEHQVEALQAANQELREQIDYAQTDAYIEQVARERLGLVHPGEVLYTPGGTGDSGP